MKEKSYFATAIEYDEEEARAIQSMGVKMTTVDGTLYRFREKNKIRVCDKAEIISPGRRGLPFSVGELYDGEGRIKVSIPHPEMIFWCRVPFDVRPGDILRLGSCAD